MSNHNQKEFELPPFDALGGQTSPFAGFGDVLPLSPELEQRFRHEAEQSRNRLRKGFGQTLGCASDIPQELDIIVLGMWRTGWNPATGNVNLFTRDFGVVLAVAILDFLGGTPTFRSDKDMSHFSIFWKGRELEAFPFHKVLKCLHNQHGESMAGFVAGLK